MSISVKGVTHRFGAYKALDNVSVEFPSRSLVALLGPSGSGKTTLLRVIAGLECPDEGSVMFHNEDATDRHVGERRVGFVFQHYALFRHMTVFENVAFGLRVRPRAERPSNDEIARRVHELLKLVQLDGMASRYPSQLSGGQRQRVALSRALAVEPQVLLLDEPFGALDARVRQELRRWLRRFHDELHVTSIFVTHDQEEALEVADQIVVMNEGRVEQIGSPDEVYQHPASPFVYTFLGDVNVFRGRVGHISLRMGDLALDTPERVGADVEYVRPHDVAILVGQSSAGLRAIVRRVYRLGPNVRVELEREDTGDTVESLLSRDRFSALGIGVGDEVGIAPTRSRMFPAERTPST